MIMRGRPFAGREFQGEIGIAPPSVGRQISARLPAVRSGYWSLCTIG